MFRFVIILVILLLGQSITLADQNIIKNIKIRTFKSKTRIVLDFSSMPGSYSVEAARANISNIVIKDTGISSDLQQTITLNNNHNVEISRNANNINLTIDVPQRKIETFTLDDPDRLVIDIRGVTKNNININTSIKNPKELYPGIVHKQYKLKGPVFVNVLDIDLNNPFVQLKPVTANPRTLFAKRNVNQMVNNSNAIAGINASFFKPPNGLPLGTLIIDNNFITGPIFNRVALVIDENNKAHLDTVKFQGEMILPDNTRLKLQNINQPRSGLEGYMIYSDRWNSYVPRTLRNELRIVIVKETVVNKTTGSIQAPYNGYVITGPNKDSFKKLKIGDKVKLEISSLSKINNIKHAIGGGPYLIKNGQIFIDAKKQKFSLNPYSREPRTAVGITKNNHLLLVTADGRQNGTIGMSFYQMAGFLKGLGATEAMNFDGGSSTQMSILGRTVNRPTVRGGALISTGIIVKLLDNVSIANKHP